MIGDAWPDVKALLPWIGSTVAVGVGLYLLRMVVVDIYMCAVEIRKFFHRRREEKREEKRERDKSNKKHLLKIMNFIADTSYPARGEIKPETERIKSKFRIYRSKLRQWKLAPHNPKTNHDWKVYVNQVIPYLKIRGIRAAQRHTERVNKSQKSS